MKTRLKHRPIGSAVLCAALCFGTCVYAQDTTNTQTNATKPAAATSGGGSTEDEYPDLVEIDPFGGVAIWGKVMQGLTTDMIDGGVAGLRLTANPSKYLGIELWAAWSQSNVEFRTSSGLYPAGFGALTGTPLPTYSFGSRNWYFGLNPILNLRPRGSKFQPYLTVGVNGIQFTPTSTAQNLARQPVNNALYHAANLSDNLQVGLNYGGGVKWHLTDHVGLRLDGRGFWSRNPTYGLPNFPDGGIYIPARNKLNGFQGTVGLVFYLGQSKCPPPPPPPPAPPALPSVTITGTEGATICQGKPVTLHANLASPPAAGRTVVYAWTLNGQQQGSNSPDFTFTPNNTGSFNVQVTVTDTTPAPPPLERPKAIPVRCWVQPPTPPPPAPVSATTTVTVNESAPQITSVTASQTTLSCAADQTGQHTANLTASVTPSACGGNLTYKWTVSEGSVTNDSSPNATFDASSLNFESGAQAQSKTVTATLTVTDETGKTASQSTTITVNCPPQFQRLDDVVFAKNNARVNNCGKRVLIDDAGRLASGDYDILLVGHRGSDERENLPAVRGRAARRRNPTAGLPLDEARVLNSLGVLSAGTGTCAKVDPSRIKVSWVGTDQTSDPRPGLCGTSNIKERKGSQVTDADKLQRVEVYLVPHGSQNLPPAAKSLQTAPDDVVKAIGCPK